MTGSGCSAATLSVMEKSETNANGAAREHPVPGAQRPEVKSQRTQPASRRPPTIGELGWQVFFYFFLAVIFFGESLAFIVPFPESGP
jgi:hypothetical protein